MIMEDYSYHHALLDAARIEQALLYTVFDPVSRRRKPQYDRHAYAQLLERLRKTQDQLRVLLRAQGQCSDIHWWSIPWEDVERAAIFCLQKELETQGWRTECEPVEKAQGEIHCLYLKEEGHFSDFSEERHSLFSKVSRYSESEQDAMVDAYRSRIERSKQHNIATMDGLVYSGRYDKVYGSARDYYDSAEYRAEEELRTSLYAKSLYEEKQTQNVTFYSRSKHFESLYHAASFTLSADGTVAHLELGQFDTPVHCVGNGKDHVGISVGIRIPCVVLCGFLAQSAAVRQIPAELFGGVFTQAALNYEDALYQAAMFSCIAHKLICDSTYRPQYRIETQQEHDEYIRLFNKFDRDEELSAQELLTIRNALKKELFSFPEDVARQAKVAILYKLLVCFMDEDDADMLVYHASICSDCAADTLAFLRTPLLWELSLSCAAFTAELYLKLGNKPSAKYYAQQALQAWEALSQIAPDHPVLKLKKTCDKVLKKASR